MLGGVPATAGSDSRASQLRSAATTHPKPTLALRRRMRPGGGGRGSGEEGRAGPGRQRLRRSWRCGSRTLPTAADAEREGVGRQGAPVPREGHPGSYPGRAREGTAVLQGPVGGGGVRGAFYFPAGARSRTGAAAILWRGRHFAEPRGQGGGGGARAAAACGLGGRGGRAGLAEAPGQPPSREGERVPFVLRLGSRAPPPRSRAECSRRVPPTGGRGPCAQSQIPSGLRACPSRRSSPPPPLWERSAFYLAVPPNATVGSRIRPENEGAFCEPRAGGGRTGLDGLGRRYLEPQRRPANSKMPSFERWETRPRCRAPA
ncbi:translation initiation factor IF-2-like [Mustela erminea]|uniref:translation initiation factor IF-2-like n=1 Tax=Mustela erminea TaxID=36723 RepID=UPI001386A40A|nr:translation initiation factor IF-2-like [Mustela erminea]